MALFTHYCCFDSVEISVCDARYLYLDMDSLKNSKTIVDEPDRITQYLSYFFKNRKALKVIDDFDEFCNPDTASPYINYMNLSLDTESQIDYFFHLCNMILENDFDSIFNYQIEHANYYLSVQSKIKKYYLNKIKDKFNKKRRSIFSQSRDKLMLKIIERDGYFCQECEITKKLSLDHIIPLSKGGSDEMDNLQILCVSCNSSKGDR